MTTNRILQVISMAATCLLFTSCFDSEVPLSDPTTSKPDERLAGVWVWQLVPEHEFRIFRVGGKLPASVMRVAVSRRKPDGTTEQVQGTLLFPTIIGDKTYLNVAYKPQTELVEEKGWTPETVPTLQIFRYQVTGDVLTLQGMVVGVKKRSVETGKIKGVIEKDSKSQSFDSSNAFFTDTTENLTKFVVEAGDDLFYKDVLKLERVK